MAPEPITDALYRALRSPEPDPDLAHAAVEEVRNQAGQNVIAAIGAQIAELWDEIIELKAEMDTRFTRLEAATETHFAKLRPDIVVFSLPVVHLVRASFLGRFVA